MLTHNPPRRPWVNEDCPWCDNYYGEREFQGSHEYLYIAKCNHQLRQTISFRYESRVKETIVAEGVNTQSGRINGLQEFTVTQLDGRFRK